MSGAVETIEAECKNGDAKPQQEKGGTLKSASLCSYNKLRYYNVRAAEVLHRTVSYIYVYSTIRCILRGNLSISCC